VNVRCDSHGLLPWLGQGECIECGMMFKHLLEAHPMCDGCGKRLLPYGKDVAERLLSAGDEENFTGRLTCAKCYVAEGRRGAAATADGEGGVDSAGYD
jgi:hypothetical protein